MEGREAQDQAGFIRKKFGLQLVAYEPYFYSDDVQVAQWTFGEGGPFLSTTEAFFPLRINGGLLMGAEVHVTNPGDVGAWPGWELTGPIKGLGFDSPAGRSV